uniref:Uncharacterized protein n=1 Tax=Anopheles coluzzii TaxID=1518534 RepID=A0A8W7PSM3_ANOCL
MAYGGRWAIVAAVPKSASWREHALEDGFQIQPTPANVPIRRGQSDAGMYFVQRYIPFGRLLTVGAGGAGGWCWWCWRHPVQRRAAARLRPDFGVEVGDSNGSSSIGDSDRAEGDIEQAENGGISSSRLPSATPLPSSDPLNGDRYPSSSDELDSYSFRTGGPAVASLLLLMLPPTVCGAVVTLCIVIFVG